MWLFAIQEERTRDKMSLLAPLCFPLPPYHGAGTHLKVIKGFRQEDIVAVFNYLLTSDGTKNILHISRVFA